MFLECAFTGTRKNAVIGAFELQGLENDGSIDLTGNCMTVSDESCPGLSEMVKVCKVVYFILFDIV